MLATRLKPLLVLAPFAAGVSAWAQTDDLKPFPAPAAGMQRFVIRLPAVPQPDDHKVEVMIGKTLQVDCNRQMFSAKVKQKVAEGWGFPYYVVGPLKGPASTLMACPPDMPKRDEFVRANAAGLDLLRYNSKLPIVVYAPEGVEVRFRVWTAAGGAESAERE